jgi:hypothetical protein
MVIIERCEKRPGIFTGARAYRLVLADEGLYILELGKAMGYQNSSNVIANKILDKIQESREKQQTERANELSTADLGQMVDNKKNFLVKKTDVKEAKAGNLSTNPKLELKSNVLNITLHFKPEDKGKVERINEYLNS